MFIIGPDLGSYMSIGDHVLEKLSGIYDATQRSFAAAEQQAEANVNQFVQELISTATSKEQGGGDPEAGEHG